jgi:hypothetical protein
MCGPVLEIGDIAEKIVAPAENIPTHKVVESESKESKTHTLETQDVGRTETIWPSMGGIVRGGSTQERVMPEVLIGPDPRAPYGYGRMKGENL